MKCKITRQKSGVEHYQYECKTHDARWLGGLDSKKPAACHRAAQHSVHTDPPSACPACGTLPEEAEHDPTCPLVSAGG